MLKSNNFDIIEALWLRKEKKRRAQKTIEGAPPLTYTAKNEGTLKNYRIYGNTVGGESVGDLVTSGEHAGEYKVPVTVSNGTDTLTTPIYLPEQIRKQGDITDYIEYSTQKFVRRIFRKIFDGTEDIKYFGPFGDHNYLHYYYNFKNEIQFQESTICAPWSNKYTSFEGWEISSIGNKCIRYQFAADLGNKNFNRIYFTDNSVSNAEDFKAMLTDWYTNGDPLIVDYIESTPVEETVTLPALPTIAGTNTLSVGTQVQPSSVKIEGKIKGVS